MNEQKTNHYALTELIAHRPPMVIISGLSHYGETSAQCWVDIDQDAPFVEEKGVPSYVGIEYMAQAIAAYAGAKCLDQGKAIQLGFLLGSRKYKTHCRYFTRGSKLLVDIEELYREESGLSVFECRITLNGEALAQANVNTFQPEDANAFLKENS